MSKKILSILMVALFSGGVSNASEKISKINVKINSNLDFSKEIKKIEAQIDTCLIEIANLVNGNPGVLKKFFSEFSEQDFTNLFWMIAQTTSCFEAKDFFQKIGITKKSLNGKIPRSNCLVQTPIKAENVKHAAPNKLYNLGDLAGKNGDEFLDKVVPAGRRIPRSHCAVINPNLVQNTKFSSIPKVDYTSVLYDLRDNVRKLIKLAHDRKTVIIASLYEKFEKSKEKDEDRTLENKILCNQYVETNLRELATLISESTQKNILDLDYVNGDMFKSLLKLLLIDASQVKNHEKLHLEGEKLILYFCNILSEQMKTKQSNNTNKEKEELLKSLKTRLNSCLKDRICFY